MQKLRNERKLVLHRDREKRKKDRRRKRGREGTQRDGYPIRDKKSNMNRLRERWRFIMK